MSMRYILLDCCFFMSIWDNNFDNQILFLCNVMKCRSHVLRDWSFAVAFACLEAVISLWKILSKFGTVLQSMCSMKKSRNIR